MKKINKYKKQLITNLIIILPTFICLITIIGSFLGIIKFKDYSFNLLSYWKYSLSSWYYWPLSFLLTFSTYIFYSYKACFLNKEEASLKETNKNDYGQAQWLTNKEINLLYPLVNSNNQHKQHGFVVNSKIIKNNLYHNLKTNTHSLVIGGTGSGKSQGLVLPTININAKSEIKPSMVITDIKGELYQTQSDLLIKEGYQVKILNLRNLNQSITWNPLQFIYWQFQTMLLTNSQQEKLQLKVQIHSDIQDLTKTLFNNKNQSDPFWTDSGSLITEAIILGILEETERKINEDKPKNKEIIKLLLSKYLPSKQFNLASVTVISSLGKDMVNWFKNFPDTSIAKITADQVLQNSSKTLTSILMTMSTNLSLFKNEFIRNLTCQNDLDFNEFINHPTALFIVIPDENQNYYLFISLLILQLYKFLVIKANENENNKLSRPVYFLCDEFGNLPAIPNIINIITLARSRNIFFQLILQDLQQLKEKYDPYTANIIFTNCSLHIFLQTLDIETAEKYSKIIGDKTVLQITTNNGNNGKQKNKSETLKGHPLILATDLIKLKTNQAIILYAKENPFQATIIPWYQINKPNNQPIIANQKLNLINFEKDYYYNIKQKKKEPKGYKQELLTE